MSLTIPRPAQSEYSPFFSTYISKVPDVDVLRLLTTQMEETTALLGGLSEEQAMHRYAPGKWSIKQVVGHLAEAERVFGYRALCFARKDAARLPGWDENAYIANADYDSRPLSALLADLRAARASTVSLFSGFNEDELARPGHAGDKQYTVRSLAYITAGHERHHLDILRERYLGTR